MYVHTIYVHAHSITNSLLYHTYVYSEGMHIQRILIFGQHCNMIQLRYHMQWIDMFSINSVLYHLTVICKQCLYLIYVHRLCLSLFSNNAVTNSYVVTQRTNISTAYN